ncbi:hypothetical protein MBLNU459_g1309t1 [Dothideomycetes sp. NU459]
MSSTREQIAKLAEPDPEFAEASLDIYLKKNPIPKLDWNDVKTFREMRAAMQEQRLAALGPPGPDIKESSKKIPMRDGFESELKIFQPTKEVPGGSPLIVLCFGGGFVVGDNQQLTPYSRGLVKLFGAVVVNISYRLAPEHPFPAAPQDAWDSVTWLGKNAASLGADPAVGFVLGGVSAGGNLTAVIAQQAQDSGFSPPLTGLWLCVPLVFADASLVPPQYRDEWFAHEQNAHAPILDKDAVDAVHRHLQVDGASPLYSPFNTKTPHTGLPPSYIQVNGMDPLRDDGLIYEKVLKDHGVKTKLDVWPGLPHAHFSFFPTLNVTKSAIWDTFNGFGWLLGKEVTPEKVGAAMAAPGGA